MSIVAYTSKELDLLARLMRAEAVGEGNLGMLMVGNVGINRVLGNCLDFKRIKSIYDMVYQSPGCFSGPNSTILFSNSTKAWYNQANSGRYKNHCFYKPAQGVCRELY